MEPVGSPHDADGPPADEEIIIDDFPPAQPVVDAAADKANAVSFLDAHGKQKSGNWEPMAPSALHQKLMARTYTWQPAFEAVLCNVHKRVTTNSLSVMHTTTSIVPVCIFRCKACKAILSPRNPSNAVAAHKCKGAGASSSLGVVQEN